MNRLVSFIVLALLAWVLSSCAAPKRECLVQAIGYKDSYEYDRRFDPYRWSRVLGIFWDDQRKLGHAVCVYDFSRKIMVQGAGEKRGGWTLTRDLSLKTSPLALARLYAPGTPIREAYFFEDL